MTFIASEYPARISTEATIVDPEPNTVQSQFARLNNNVGNLQKIVQLLHEHTAGYQKLPSVPPGQVAEAMPEGTSTAHDRLHHINNDLEAEIDRLHSLYSRLDL